MPELADICHYYLACLGQVDTGVSVLARGNPDNLDYGELNALPENEEELQQNENYQRLIGRIRENRSPFSMFLGYPTYLRRDNNSWRVEPILLFPIEIDENQPRINTEHPILNQKPLSSFTNAERGEFFINELVQLEKELDIGQEGAEISVLARKIRHIRNEWPWKEDINPNIIGNNPSLCEIRQAGIYNRAVVVITGIPPFVQGLESELTALAKRNDIVNTALGQWLAGVNGAEQQPEKSPPLLEVFPMNFEQRKAVNLALTRPLTVITGPPGTGKSQVVSNLLINAAYQGKSVLFSSKNHKAVDVVEERINGLVPDNPILLRLGWPPLGRLPYQRGLIEYLTTLLNHPPPEENENNAYNNALNEHKRLWEYSYSYDKQVRELITSRNDTDRLERRVERIRVNNEQLFNDLRDMDILSLEEDFHSFKMVIELSEPKNRVFFTRMAWPLYKFFHFRKVAPKIKMTIELAKRLYINAEIPDEPFNEKSLSQWNDFSKLLEECIRDAKLIKEYYCALNTLQECDSLERIVLRQVACFGNIVDVSKDIWRLWVQSQRTQPEFFDQNQLRNYIRQIEQNVNEEGHGVLRFPLQNCARMLPCWSITSLSARGGRLPFTAGFFDLVVFDEASQCDIASALPLLYRAKSAVIIGDNQQLSHISGLNNAQDRKLLNQYELMDHPEWSYSQKSLFDLARRQHLNGGMITLLEHHRSHADIIEFSNKEFYKRKLRIATHHRHLNLIPPDRPDKPDNPGVIWWNVPGMVTMPHEGRGAINIDEVNGVVAALRHLVFEREYQGSIGVVSPFRAQVNAISVAVKNIPELDTALHDREFLVNTVHKFQGDERDVIIFSPVLSRGMTDGALRFLRKTGNLFNVAITRARAHLIVVGDWATCRNCDVRYIRNFALYSQQLRQRKVDTTSIYPLVDNSEQVSKWEKFFYEELHKEKIITLPQYREHQYALDLAIIDENRKLDIEIDGEMYHRNWTGELCRRDQTRNQRLKELGWDVMRFWVYEIRDDLPSCIAKVKEWLQPPTGN